MGSSQHCITCTDIIETFKEHILQEDEIQSQSHIQTFLDRLALEVGVIKRDLDFEPLEVTEELRPLNREEPNGGQNDVYMTQDDAIGDQNDAYMAQDDAIGGINDPNRGHNDANCGQNDVIGGQNDANEAQNDSNGNQNDAYMAQDDTIETQKDDNGPQYDSNGLEKDSCTVEENEYLADKSIEAIPVLLDGTNSLVEDDYVIKQDGVIAPKDDPKPDLSDTEALLDDINETNSDSEWHPNEKEKAKSEKKPRKAALRDENGRRIRIRPKRIRGPRLTKRKWPTEPTYFCDQCGKGFTRPGYLSIHIKGVHENAREKVCEHCGLKCLTNVQLKRHIAHVHMKVKAFSCTECPAAFSLKHAMQTHVKSVHLKIKPFVCEICGMACAENYLLKKHIRAMHDTGEKRYKCDQCELRSDSMAVIKVHVNSVHLGKKTHQCEFCPMMFAEKFTMKRHIKRIHEQAMPFVCEICQMKFKYQTTLKNHVKKKHSERDQDDEAM